MSNDREALLERIAFLESELEIAERASQANANAHMLEMRNRRDADASLSRALARLNELETQLEVIKGLIW
jgi:hypothetical protein